jgi:hypothetical protein
VNTCKTCASFKAFSDFDRDYHGAEAGECDDPHFVYKCGYVPIASLTYWDQEGYAAGFYVHELFGCIHWKEKK